MMVFDLVVCLFFVWLASFCLVTFTRTLAANSAGTISLGLLARRLAGNGPALGILGLYHNPGGGGGFLSLVELNKFRKAWAHLFNDSMNFGFIDLTVMGGLACGAEAIISR